MTAPVACRLIGRWRIVETNPWDRCYLDLGEPAVLTIHEDGHGEIAFGALNASLKIVSSMKLHRDLEITQKSAWHLAHRLR